MEASASWVDTEDRIFLGILFEDGGAYQFRLTKSQANLIRTELECAIKEAANA